MAEEPNPKNPNNIEMKATAHGESKVTQVGQINAAEVKIFVDRIEPILERLQQIPKVESPGVLKAGNSPKSLAYWQGRKTEIAQIQQWLIDDNTFLIGIEGIGGIGKSMLAAKIYQEIEGFPKRFWCDVSNGASFSDLARQVLTEFDFQVPEEEVKLVEALVKCLRTGQFLLIIDNLESLLQPDRRWGSLFYGDFFNAWVEFGDNSKVLVTTRERPELKSFKWLSLKGLQVKEGVALLAELGIRGNLVEFVELVDGHPLLLRLVADLLKEEYGQDPDLQRLADLGLGNLQQLLTDPQVVGVHRRENVGMVLVLDASFARLSELQKTLLLNVSVYRGSFDSAAAVAVLPGSSEKEIDRELRNLVKRSLLVEKLEDKRRFEFQPVVLEYARYKAGDQTEAHQRAIDYYRSIAKQPPWTTKDDVKEYLEIFHHFYQLQNYDSAFDTIEICGDFLRLKGYYTTGIEIYEQLVKEWEKIQNKENGKYQAALSELGYIYLQMGKYKQANKFYRQLFDIGINDPYRKALILYYLGNSYYCLKDYYQAINFYQQSCKIAKNRNYPDIKAVCLNGLGLVHHEKGEQQKAIGFYHQALEIAMQIDNPELESKFLGNLGNVYQSLGKYPQAIDYHKKSLQIARKRSDSHWEAACLNNLGDCYYFLGKYQQAIEFHEESLQIARQINVSHVEANAWRSLGLVLEKRNRKSDALGAYRNACELYQVMGLDAEVQDCNNAIERLSRRGFWVWLRRLWRWLRAWFRR